MSGGGINEKIDFYLTHLEKTGTTPTTDKDNYSIYNVENIPLCYQCLFEIKEGNFICEECKINLCENHKSIHINSNNLPQHKIIKLIKKI